MIEIRDIFLDIKKEVWKDIPGYEGLYQVSNMGRVMSLVDVGKPIILKGEITENGYRQVSLSNRKRYKVHRLVAMAFIPNPEGLPQVNHKNEIKTDNKADNLEWCTAQYNNNYGTKIARYCVTRGKKVQCIETGQIYINLKTAANDMNLDYSHIAKCCRGVLSHHKGLHFKYI